MTTIWREGSRGGWEVRRNEFGYFDLYMDGAFVYRFDNMRQFLAFTALMQEAAREVERPWWTNKENK